MIKLGTMLHKRWRNNHIEFAFKITYTLHVVQDQCNTYVVHVCLYNKHVINKELLQFK